MRSYRGAWVLVVLLVVLLGVWWTVQHYGSFPAVHTTQVTPPLIPPIRIHHKHTNNVHAYSGELNVRPCDSFSTQMQTTNGNSTHITLAFVITPGSCTTQAEPAPFATSFSSSEKDVPVVSAVLINGTETPFVIVEDK